MFKIIRLGFLLCCALCLVSTTLILAQQNQTEYLTITTYFPSPNGAFANLEVKRKLIVGDITQSGNLNLDEISELGEDRAYANESLYLNQLTGEPTAAQSKPGQIIFNNSTKKLELYNGTWQPHGN